MTSDPRCTSMTAWFSDKARWNRNGSYFAPLDRPDPETVQAACLIGAAWLVALPGRTLRELHDLREIHDWWLDTIDLLTEALTSLGICLDGNTLTKWADTIATYEQIQAVAATFDRLYAAKRGAMAEGTR